MRYTNNFFNPAKSRDLCHSGPGNHSHKTAENSAVGAPELRQEVLGPGLGLRGGPAGRQQRRPRPEPRPDLPGDCRERSGVGVEPFRPLSHSASRQVLAAFRGRKTEGEKREAGPLSRKGAFLS